MRMLWKFFRMRFVQFRHDKMSIFFSYGIPIIMITGLGFFFNKPEQAKIRLHYLPVNGNPAATRVLSNLAASETIELIAADFDRQEGERLLRKNLISFLLDFERRSLSAPFTLSFNTQTPEATLMEQAVLFAAGSPDTGPFPNVLGRNVVLEKPKPYIYTIFPGMLGMVLFTIALVGMGSVLVDERSQGILKKIKTIDADPFAFLGGMVLSRLLVCVSLLFVLLPLATYLFGLKNEGSLVLLTFTVLLGSLSFLGIALWLAGVCQSQGAFMGLSNLIQLPLVALGGVFFSYEILPSWLREISIFSPLTAFIVAFTRIIYEGIGLAQVGQVGKEMAILLFWSMGSFVLGWKSFKW